MNDSSSHIYVSPNHLKLAERQTVSLFAHIRNLRIERSPKMASEPKSDTHRGMPSDHLGGEPLLHIPVESPPRPSLEFPPIHLRSTSITTRHSPRASAARDAPATPVHEFVRDRSPSRHHARSRPHPPCRSPDPVPYVHIQLVRWTRMTIQPRR